MVLPVTTESNSRLFEEVARTGKLSSAQKYPAGGATDLLRGAWPRTLRAPLPTLPVMRPGLAAKLGQNPALVASVAPKIALEFKTNEEVVFIRGYIAYDRLVRAGRPTRDGR
jgi:hypothetical protein